METEKDIFSKLVEKAKINKLTEREQRALFLAVDTYVENNPIYIKESAPEHAGSSGSNGSNKIFSKSSKRSQPIPSPFMSGMSDRFQIFVSSWHIHSFKTVIAVFVIMIFGVGGSSLAAQNSLPGNFLYPIKVNINEGIKTVLLSGPARAAYEVERVKIRIDEARQLVAQDKLTDEIQNQLATRLNSHVSSVQKDIDTLTKKGNLKVAFEISSDLEHSLQESKVSVAAELPVDASVSSTVSDQELAFINKIIDVPLEASAVVRENAEDQISTLQANDESTKVIALAKFESVKKIVQEIDQQNQLADSQTMVSGTADVVSTTIITAKVSPSAKLNSNPSAGTSAALGANGVKEKTETPKTTDKLAEVRELLQQGEEKLNAGSYDDAFSLFKHAYDLAQLLKTAPQSKAADPDYLGELL